MNIQINRDLTVPIYTQIVGQLQFGIVSGQLPSGAQLPSIRELAQELNVAPMTITQAYQDLRQLELIEMRAGLGTFVADFSVEVAQAPVPNRPLQLRRLLWRTIAEAKGAGFSQDEIRQTFLPLLTDSNSLFANRYLMLFGLFPSALQVYADDMERNLAEERVVVEPVCFDEFDSRPAYYQADLERAEALLVPLHQVQMLRDLLRANDLDGERTIMGLGFALRPSAHQAIAALPTTFRLGIVSRFPEFVNTMLQGIASAREMQSAPTVCLSTDGDGLQAMIHSVQAIIFATGAEEAIDDLRTQMSLDFPFIEYLHTPDQNSYQRILQLLAVEKLGIAS